MHYSISDLITRIKNASRNNIKEVRIAHSNKLEAITKVLNDAHFILSYNVENVGKGKKELVIQLRYTKTGTSIINDIVQVSKPGLRIYNKSADIKWTQNGIGLSIISTSKGIVSERFAKENNLGGEVILKVW